MPHPPFVVKHFLHYLSVTVLGLLAWIYKCPMYDLSIFKPVISFILQINLYIMFSQKTRHCCLCTNLIFQLCKNDGTASPSRDTESHPFNYAYV